MAAARQHNRAAELRHEFRQVGDVAVHFREFDDRITAYYCGFAGADDYYARAAAANVVDRIAVPTLIIHAANDPFIRMLPETRERISRNPNITYIETHDGGHCAFVGVRNGDPGDDGRWAEKEVVEFARQVG